MRFKYKLEDLSCGFCNDVGNRGCTYDICPYIMENINDLFEDKAFCKAVENAETCSTFHRRTLMLLKKFEDKEKNKLLDSQIQQTVFDNVQPEVNEKCKSCPFPADGFICHSKSEICLKDHITTDLERMKKQCPA